MPQQINRLIIVFSILIGLFLIVRLVLKPKSFGELGHYRALAIPENKDKPIKYIGEQTCNDCHDDIVSLKNENVHINLECETCHGAGYLHIEDSELNKPIIPNQRKDCGTCHQKNAARSLNNIIQIELSEHNPDYKCIDCHNPHHPYEFRD